MRCQGKLSGDRLAHSELWVCLLRNHSIWSLVSMLRDFPQVAQEPLKTTEAILPEPGGWWYSVVQPEGREACFHRFLGLDLAWGSTPSACIHWMRDMADSEPFTMTEDLQDGPPNSPTVSSLPPLHVTVPVLAWNTPSPTGLFKVNTSTSASLSIEGVMPLPGKPVPMSLDLPEVRWLASGLASRFVPRLGPPLEELAVFSRGARGEALSAMQAWRALWASFRGASAEAAAALILPCWLGMDCPNKVPGGASVARKKSSASDLSIGSVVDRIPVGLMGNGDDKRRPRQSRVVAGVSTGGGRG
mmetsp:Transcript_833/g.2517  ORF Transcript_833/g.2517 Transcript_833/m.2517 type:complete len:302 (-) Transcript_833:5-910(-)